jgi:2'-hydroxyisoflavone reductase
MPTNLSRRGFLTASAASVAAGGLTPWQPALAAREGDPPAPTPGKAEKPLRILILGGTGFIGPHQVRYAIARGHKVTLFNRGKTNPGLFPDVEQLLGDRNGQLDALKGRQWDAVIDNPATLPRWVRDSAGLLKDAAQQYVFISTISAYADNAKPGADESAPTAAGGDPEATKITGQTYGPLKAQAEREAEKAFPGKATIIRPGLIVGPGDPTDRFSYWPVRIDKGGEVLAPGDGTDPVQFIDARDLAEWTIRVVEQKAMGAYNALGPKATLTMAEMLYGIRAITPAEVRFTWVGTDFLQKQGVSAWGDMPVWVPGTGDSAGFSRRSNARAIAQGLTFRPLAETAKSALDEHKASVAAAPADKPVKLEAGIAPDKEKAVLTAWHTTKAG